MLKDVDKKTKGWNVKKKNVKKKTERCKNRKDLKRERNK